MNAYEELRYRHQKEFDAFPIHFAFDNKQFEEGMAKFGLTPQDTDKVLYIGCGGYIRKEDEGAFDAMIERQCKERKEAIAADKTGDGYLFDMFRYELANHEYGYTGDIRDTLDDLDLTLEEIKADSALDHALHKALDLYSKYDYDYYCP